MTKRADSPIVKTIRKAREKLSEECKYNLQILLEYLKQQEKLSGKKTETPPRRAKRQ